MYGLSLEQHHYDAIVLGTGLPESIVATALAKSGRSVLHIDENPQYGGDWASLTIEEIAKWAAARKGTDDSTTYLSNQRRQFQHISLRYPSAPDSPNNLPPSLSKESRHYALSLHPSLLVTPPSSWCDSPQLLSTLLTSGVSKYSTFRLLEGIGVWDDAGTRVKKVPRAKEDVFKDREMGLVDKRVVMRYLKWVGEGEWEDVPADNLTLVNLLETAFSVPPHLLPSLAYAVSLSSSPDEPARPALERTRKYLLSHGRFGSSSFLVGQYGGAGELGQGFCRMCAVHGGTYILNQPISSLSIPSPTSDSLAPVSVTVSAFSQPLTASHLIAGPSYLPSSFSSEKPFFPQRRLARALLILDKPPLLAGETLVSGLLVFPPGSITGGLNKYAVSVLWTGESTGSCPRGRWVVYFVAAVPSDDSREAGEVLEPYIATVLSLAVEPPPSSSDQGQDAPPAPPQPPAVPFLRLTYSQYLPDEQPTQLPSNVHVIPHLPTSDAALFVEGGEEAASWAERVYWEVVGGKESAEERGDEYFAQEPVAPGDPEEEEEVF